MIEANQSPEPGSEFKYIDPQKNYSREEILKMDFDTLQEYAQLLDKRVYLISLELIKKDEELVGMRKNQVLGAFSVNYPENVHKDEEPTMAEEPTAPKQPRLSP